MAVTRADARSSVLIRPRPASHLREFLQALAATLIVTVAPVAVVWLLRDSGLITSIVLGVVIAIALSLVLGWLVETVWTRRRDPDDVVFSELMLWGWLRRLRDERRLANADRMLRELSVADGERRARQGQRLLRQLANAIDAQDNYLDGHSRRVAHHAGMIARQMGLSRQEVARIRAAAAIHDVGKLNVPLAVLDKPGPLTNEEFELIKRHPVDGESIVSALGDPEINSIVRHHHERLDGRGYPDGMAGADIPIGARIVAVADTFDAVTSTRAYRHAAPHRQALEILKGAAGTQLDPDAVHAFMSHYAGRRPLAIWATFGAVTQRALRRTAYGTSGATYSTGKLVVLAAATAAIGVGAVTATHRPGSTARPIIAAAQLSAAAPFQQPQTHGSDVRAAIRPAVPTIRLTAAFRRHRLVRRAPSRMTATRRASSRVDAFSAIPMSSVPGVSSRHPIQQAAPVRLSPRPSPTHTSAPAPAPSPAPAPVPTSSSAPAPSSGSPSPSPTTVSSQPTTGDPGWHHHHGKPNHSGWPGKGNGGVPGNGNGNDQGSGNGNGHGNGNGNGHANGQGEGHGHGHAGADALYLRLERSPLR